jgi:hypothetical protein
VDNGDGGDGGGGAGGGDGGGSGSVGSGGGGSGSGGGGDSGGGGGPVSYGSGIASPSTGTNWNCVETGEAIVFLPTSIGVVAIIVGVKVGGPFGFGLAITSAGLIFLTQSDIFQYCSS